MADGIILTIGVILIIVSRICYLGTDMEDSDEEVKWICVGFSLIFDIIGTLMTTLSLLDNFSLLNF